MRIFAIALLITTISASIFALGTTTKTAEKKREEMPYVRCANRSVQSIRRELRSIFASLPHRIEQETLTRILKHPVQFLCDAKIALHNTPRDVLKLVDKQHSIGNYTPHDIIQLDAYKDILTLNKKGLQLRNVAVEPLLAMVHDAAEEGITLPLSSTYRSYEYQKKVFARHVKTLGKARASRESARAGTSQHQLGLAIDFGCICPEFENTLASQWLTKNAWRYGFSLSFPKNQEHITGYIFESWHYRYIGNYAAAFEKKYFTKGQQHVLELFQHEKQLLAL